MRTLITYSLLLSALSVGAQNWQCLQAGVKHYFTNDNHYLRGIRIDSVRTRGDSTIYYPFHTLRGFYEANPVLDSNGGSWLGKAVVERNGTFVFDNFLGDTIVIKTLASTGDTWTFYKDSTTLHYEASVAELDTMTVLGMPDSIKRILIRAYGSSVLVRTDPVDSMEIVLSKAHGFVQVMDLYMFPYHEPGRAFAPGLDYYLDNALWYYGHYGFYASPLPSMFHFQRNLKNVLFSILPIANVTHRQLYSWAVGDVYEFSNCNGLGYWNTAECDPVKKYLLDTITGSFVGTSNTIFSYSGVESDYHSPSGFIVDYGGYYTTVLNTGSEVADTSPIFNLNRMPEEYLQSNLFFYAPSDTSYCIASALYGTSEIDIDRYRYLAFFESGPRTFIYKQELGLVQVNFVGTDALFMVYDNRLIYYNRNGQTCGGFQPLAIPETQALTAIDIAPNPASDVLLVTINDNDQHNITMVSMLGQVVYQHTNAERHTSIRVTDLPTGIYIIQVENAYGVRTLTKVNITH